MLDAGLCADDEPSLAAELAVIVAIPSLRPENHTVQEAAVAEMDVYSI